MELLRVSGLKKYFPVSKKFASAPLVLKAVDGISLSVDEDKVFALVGESGCGKSTVARIVLRLMPPTAGDIVFEGKNIFELKGDSLKKFRRSVQIVFQDPFASLNPRKTVFDTIAEPLKIHKIADKKDMRDRCVELLKKVGLGAEAMKRYPHEFSGGQRQRICIARALSVNPRLIVADEPLSALDVSIQAQILNLLQELKKETKIAFLFISHDLKVVHYFSDIVGVMYLGKIVEHAKTEDLFEDPLHPYTEILLSSAPKIKSDRFSIQRKAPSSKLQTPNSRFGPHSGGFAEENESSKETKLITITGEVPSPINMPSGCPFHPRCPRRFEPCDKRVPVLKQVQDQEAKGRLVACHLWNPW
ncbi:MAG: ATP-binding cassette domain-containing protein [Nitrospirae bacterium]|nr:ATP-binding cassette domain-containing protein [Nitrospirota bacterium]